MKTLINSEGLSVDKTVLLPFSLSHFSLKKLALINFEKNPDSKYIGLEPQYFEDEHYGNGYRVIAYRCDGYVDVYDDVNLNNSDSDNFDVAGKGLCERKKIVIENTRFERVDGCVTISFKFIDKYGREIVTNIKEQSMKKTNGINLLAPIGSSSENPSSLPLFFLYDFDFVRKHNTHVEVTIAGKSIELDSFPFPVPKDFQWRYYARYSDDCQIINFANASNSVLEEYTLDSNSKVISDSVEYQFVEDRTLVKIAFINSSHALIIEFNQAFPDIYNLMEHSNVKGTFKITAGELMGFLSGEYLVKREANNIQIELVTSDGWIPVKNSIFSKLMFSKKSVFCSWPKTYRYKQTIDITTLQSTSYWERIE